MKKSMITSAVAISILMGATVAMAGGPDMPMSSSEPTQSVDNGAGFYLGADVGYGAFRSGSDVGKFDVAESSGLNTTDSGVVFGAHAGYNINRYIAAQLSYMYLPRVSVSYGSSSGHIYNNMVALEAKGMYPLMDDKLIPFATAGYGVIFETPSGDVSGSKHVWEPVLGAGMEYKVTPHIGVNAQYKAVLNVNNNYSTVNMGLAGLNYYF